MDFGFSEEQKSIQEMARKFAEAEVKPLAGEADEKEIFPRAQFEKMAALGFTGITCPREYGGLGLDHVTYIMVMEEIGKACLATAGTYSVHQTVQYYFEKFGTEEQKKKYLPDLAKGKKIGALVLTEPGAGSDVASLTTRAEKKDGFYIINGNKIFITTGGEADLYIVLARTGKAVGAKGISAFIVDKDSIGLSIGKKEKKMGYGGSPTTELIFTDCNVSAKDLLGGMEGQGMVQMLSALDMGRISIGSIAVGIAQDAFEEALAYSKERVQFGKPIFTFQGIQWMFADMATRIEAARLLCYQAAYSIDQDNPLSIKQASMAKMMATDVAMSVTTDAVQILGGYGYMKDYPLERHMRDAKILQIVEGTNQIQKIVIARCL